LANRPFQKVPTESSSSWLPFPFTTVNKSTVGENQKGKETFKSFRNKIKIIKKYFLIERRKTFFRENQTLIKN
jgi:hypothetical protein